MNPVDSPPDPRGDRIRDYDKFRGLRRLYKVLMPGVAITGVVAQFNSCWNVITKLHETFDGPLLRIIEIGTLLIIL